MMIKLLLIDDHELVRHGVKSLVSSVEGMQVVGDFGSYEEAVPHLASLEIDIVLLDISLPGLSGLQAAQLINQIHPKIKIIILSSFKDEEYVLESMKYEIQGYVVKSAIADHIVNAIREVVSGGIYFTEDVMNIALNRFENAQRVRRNEREVNLTKREKEVLEKISLGHTNQEIARALFISERTVEAHRSNVIKKMNAKNTADMIRKALQLNLIS